MIIIYVIMMVNLITIMMIMVHDGQHDDDDQHGEDDQYDYHGAYYYAKLKLICNDRQWQC